MTSEYLRHMNIGETITVGPLFIFGGINLGGVELTLTDRIDGVAIWEARYLGVKIGRVHTSAKNPAKWEFVK